MDINDLYDKLELIFVDHTTHFWKNGWQHEGDRGSKNLNIQNRINCNNLFLLEKSDNYNGFSLSGPHRFKIELQIVDFIIRVDIESTKEMNDVDIYYYIDNELDWMSHMDFIVDLCKNVYDASVKIRETILTVPSDIYGSTNPKFAQKFHRERVLNDLGIKI